MEQEQLNTTPEYSWEEIKFALRAITFKYSKYHHFSLLLTVMEADLLGAEDLDITVSGQRLHIEAGEDEESIRRKLEIFIDKLSDDPHIQIVKTKTSEEVSSTVDELPANQKRFLEIFSKFGGNIVEITHISHLPIDVQKELVIHAIRKWRKGLTKPVRDRTKFFAGVNEVELEEFYITMSCVLKTIQLEDFQNAYRIFCQKIGETPVSFPTPTAVVRTAELGQAALQIINRAHRYINVNTNNPRADYKIGEIVRELKRLDVATELIDKIIIWRILMTLLLLSLAEEDQL